MQFLKNILKYTILLCFILLSSTNVFSKSISKELLLFCPASLRDAMQEVIGIYKHRKKNIRIVPVFLGTSQLAKQIYNGAAPDIFISANKEWMDFLEAKGLIIKNYRRNYLSNSLVVITSKNNYLKKKPFANIEDTIKSSSTRISLALVNAVPAGIYARQALESLNLWNHVKSKIAQSSNVRTAMQFVTREDLEFAIVYKSDAIAAKGDIKIIHNIDVNLHNKIMYPIVTLNNNNETIDFYNFLLERQSILKMEKWGFKKYHND